MPNNEQRYSSGDEADQNVVQEPASFALRRARVINAVRRSRQRQGLKVAGASALAEALRQPTRGRL